MNEKFLRYHLAHVGNSICSFWVNYQFTYWFQDIILPSQFKQYSGTTWYHNWKQLLRLNLLFSSNLLLSETVEMWTPTLPSHIHTWPHHHLHIDMSFLRIDPNFSFFPKLGFIGFVPGNYYHIVKFPISLSSKQSPSACLSVLAEI